MEILLKDGTEYELSAEDYIRYSRTYRNIDIDQEFLEMESWCIDHPSQRKTRRGAPKFINGWLSRANKKALLKRNTGRTRDRTLEQDLTETDWAYRQ